MESTMEELNKLYSDNEFKNLIDDPIILEQIAEKYDIKLGKIKKFSTLYKKYIK